METALDRSAAQGKDLEHRAEAMAANRDEVCLQLHLAIAVVSFVLFTVTSSYCCCIRCFVYSYI